MTLLLSLERRNCIPSTPLRFRRDDKGEAVLSGKVGLWMKGTAGPSTSLGFGRDTKGSSAVPTGLLDGAFPTQDYVLGYSQTSLRD